MAITSSIRKYKASRPQGSFPINNSFGFAGHIAAPEGLVSVDADIYGDEQYLNMTAVVDGHEYRMFQTRTRRDFVTERGATIIAGRWLRELNKKNKRR